MFSMDLYLLQCNAALQRGCYYRMRRCQERLKFAICFCRGTTGKCPAVQWWRLIDWDPQSLQQPQWKNQCSRGRWVFTISLDFCNGTHNKCLWTTLWHDIRDEHLIIPHPIWQLVKVKKWLKRTSSTNWKCTSTAQWIRGLCYLIKLVIDCSE